MNGNLHENVLELIGQTPLIRVRNLAEPSWRANVYAKMEHLNPGGSVKDRICLSMIETAEKDGRLGPGGTVIEPTSGNTGIGLALVCGAKGYKCVLTMPESMSLERRQLLQALGAKVVLTKAEEQMQGAIDRARELGEKTPGAFLPGQFDNRENPHAHARTTAEEIIAAMGNDSVDALVVGVGTGGTVSGVGRVLRERKKTRIIAVEPESSATISRGEHGPSKIQGLAAGFVPDNYDRSVVDEVRTVSDRDAWRTKQELARREGLLVGISAGANIFASLAVAKELGPGKNVITVLCDTGERYFSLADYFPEDP
jgi:cysteine synthase A